MVTSENPSAIFWHIPKTSGESISQWFRDNIENAEIGDTGRKKHKVPTSRSSDKKTLYWAVVRNPYERCASMYRYKIGKGDKFVESYPTFESWCYSSMDRHVGHVGVTGPQWNWAKSCNLLLRYENLEEDFKQIQELYNCWEPLPVVNSSDRSVDTVYTKEMRERVHRKYRVDFDNLGYEK